MTFEFKNNQTNKNLVIGAESYLKACMKLLNIHNKNNNTDCNLHDIKDLYEFVNEY